MTIPPARHMTTLIRGSHGGRGGDPVRSAPADAADGNGDPIAAIARDCQAHHRLLGEYARDVIWVYTAEDGFVFVSPSVTAVLGVSPEAVKAGGLDGAFTADSLPAARALVHGVLADGPAGTAQRADLAQPAGDGGVVWVDCLVTPLHDAEGRVLGVLGIGRDITERKQAEARLAQAHRDLMKAEKLASLGGLVPGIAHEVNTPVGIAVTSASHLKRETDRLQAAFKERTLTATMMAEYIDEAAEAARMLLANSDRAAELIQSFSDSVADQGFTILLASHDYSLEHEYALTRKMLEHRVDGMALIGVEHA